MTRALVAMVLVLATVVAGSGAPAYASGTLTSTSFTTSGTGYAVTSARNTRYDWSYTTTTAATQNRVAMSVPAGTSAAGNKYLDMWGVGSVATPDSVANSPTSGDLDFRAKVREANWSNGLQNFIGKWQISTYQSYWFGTNGGYPALYWNSSATGANNRSQLSSAAVPFANNTTGWLRATLKANDGSGNTVITFYTSTDGMNWTVLGTPLTQPGASSVIYDSALPVTVGMNPNPDGVSPTNQLYGAVYIASMASGITGTTTTAASTCSSTGIDVCFYPPDDTSATANWTSSSPQAEPWTLSRGSQAQLLADIAVDLNVAGVSGVPSGGTANLRYLDGTASYYFTATGIGSGVPCTIGLSGFTNTSVAGAYSSTILTLYFGTTDDVGTTSALPFTSASNTTNVSATIDPTFTFTIGTNTVCDGYTYTAGSTSSGTGVGLGHVGTTQSVSGQNLTIATNAANGATVYLRSTGSLTNGSRNFASVSGTFASPSVFPATGTEAFGYHTPNGMSPTGWAAVSTSNSQVWSFGYAIPASSTCVAYAAQTSPTTPAGSYSATIIYTAVPTF